MSSRPDFHNRNTWIDVLRRTASGGAEVPADIHDSAPPIRPFGPEDPAIRAWNLVIDSPRSTGGDGLLHLAGPPEAGPFLPRPDDLAIEVWTECELCVLHAVWRWVLPATTDILDETSTRLLARVETATAWHLEHTQPDNATTHPWAIHAVLELGGDRPEVVDYAGSILHAVEAAGYARDGVDPLSRWILLDAARGLEQRAGRPLGAGASRGGQRDRTS